jgi:hypothetical protein
VSDESSSADDESIIRRRSGASRLAQCISSSNVSNTLLSTLPAVDASDREPSPGNCSEASDQED